MNYKVTECKLSGLLEMEIVPFIDDRGYVFEPWNDKDLNNNETVRKHYPEGINFVQELQSGSSINTVRGLHYQLPDSPMAKMFRCINGKVLAVAVDIRSSSDSYMEWHSIELTPESFKQFFVPVGFAFGFSVLSDYAEVHYKQTGFYSKSHNMCMLYSSKILGIEWKVNNSNLSEQDRLAPDAIEYIKSPIFR